MSALPSTTPTPWEGFAPITRNNLTALVARRVRAMIARGDFGDGDRLPPISEMARRFEVSISTVREALRTLEAVAVVEFRQGTGVYVRSPA
jgi:DNA-binding FadR family transcriptional regulator